MKVFFIETTLKLERYVENLESEERIDRASSSIVMIFHGHVDLPYIIYIYTYTYVCYAGTNDVITVIQIYRV